LITRSQERQNLLIYGCERRFKMLLCQRFALHWNVLPGEFSELVASGGEDTDAGCNDRV